MFSQPREKKQIGKVVSRMVGDYRQHTYPGGGSWSLKEWVLRRQSRIRDGYGSHNGRHKMG